MPKNLRFSKLFLDMSVTFIIKAVNFFTQGLCRGKRVDLGLCNRMDLIRDLLGLETRVIFWIKVKKESSRPHRALSLIVRVQPLL